MAEKSTRAIPAENILRSPIETLAHRTRSGVLFKEPELLRFQFQRVVRIEGFDFLDCDAGVRVAAIRLGAGRPSWFDGEKPLAELDSRIYGPWKMPTLQVGQILEIELDGEGRYAFILRTTEI